jgi:hypothetical protein
MKKKDLFERISLLEEVVHNLSEKVETLLEPGENDTIIDGLVERIIDLETIVNAMAKAAKTPAPAPKKEDVAWECSINGETVGYLTKESASKWLDVIFPSKPAEQEPAPELPKRWEDLTELKGAYISNGSEVVVEIQTTPVVKPQNHNFFASRKEAESALAMAQLSQLMKVYRGGWVPDWKDVYQVKHCIYAYGGELKRCNYETLQHYLCFPTQTISEQFLTNFRPLINQFFMID